MSLEIEAPTERLPKNIIRALIWGEIIEDSIILIVLGVLWFLQIYFSWKFWIGWILIAITVIFIVSSVWAMLIRPFLMYKHMRYDVSEDYFQLKSGALIEKYELVPMTKIQSVETNQGPIMHQFELYSVSIETLGSTHEIPGLPEGTAIDLRNKIAYYAKIKEVDS